MSDPKIQPSTPDSLTKASKDAGIALSESELSKVSGGETTRDGMSFDVARLGHERLSSQATGPSV